MMVRLVKIIIAVILLVAVLAAGGCGSGEDSSTTPTPPSTTVTSRPASTPTTPSTTVTSQPASTPTTPSTTATSQPAARPVVGSPAPYFELKSMEGQTVSPGSLAGHPVLLNFWATWCGPCRYEVPFLQELATDPAWQERDLEVVAIDIQESEEEVRRFQEAFGMTYRVLLDSSSAAADLYNIRGIPTTFFIDKDGIIQYIKIGAFLSKQEIEMILEQTIIVD